MKNRPAGFVWALLFLMGLAGNALAAEDTGKWNAFMLKELGIEAMGRADYKTALAYFNQALRLKPEKNTGAILYYQRGCVHDAMSRTDMAIADYGEAIRLNPEYGGAYEKQGDDYYAKKEYDRAIADYDEAIRLNPVNTETWANRGLAYAFMGNQEKAILDYDEAIRLDRKNADAYVDRGVAYEYEEKYWRAIRDFNRALRTDPNSVDAYLGRGYCYDSDNHYDKSIADLNEAIRLGGEDSSAHRVRGDALEDKGEYALAIADYRAAIRIDPANPWAYDSFARILAACPQAEFRDGKKAVSYAVHAAKLSHWQFPDNIQTVAEAYAEAGNFNNAVKYEQRYLNMPGLSMRKIADGKKRLALYEVRKPYREQMAKRTFWTFLAP